jgi:hypothetical protein
MNDLLTVLSHRAELSFDEVYRIIEHFQPSHKLSGSGRFEQYQYLHHLELLGHCEIDNEGRKIYCNASYFILLPRVGVYQALLCGARNDAFLNNLKNLVNKYKDDVNLIIRKSNIAHVPEIIILESNGVNHIKLISNELNINFSIGSPLEFL